MDTKHIKYLLDLFEEAVEERTRVYELAEDENDENKAAAQCSEAKAELINAINELLLNTQKNSA